MIRGRTEGSKNNWSFLGKWIILQKNIRTQKAKNMRFWPHGIQDLLQCTTNEIEIQKTFLFLPPSWIFSYANSNSYCWVFLDRASPKWCSVFLLDTFPITFTISHKNHILVLEAIDCNLVIVICSNKTYSLWSCSSANNTMDPSSSLFTKWLIR